MLTHKNLVNFSGYCFCVGLCALKRIFNLIFFNINYGDFLPFVFVCAGSNARRVKPSRNRRAKTKNFSKRWKTIKVLTEKYHKKISRDCRLKYNKKKSQKLHYALCTAPPLPGSLFSNWQYFSGKGFDCMRSRRGTLNKSIAGVSRNVIRLG